MLTIREQMQRSRTRMSWVVVPAVIALALAPLWLFPNAPAWLFGVFPVLVGLSVGLTTNRVTNRSFICPRCGADFREIRWKQLGRFAYDRRMYWDLWDKCPQCGVSFDAPYEQVG